MIILLHLILKQLGKNQDERSKMKKKKNNVYSKFNIYFFLFTFE